MSSRPWFKTISGTIYGLYYNGYPIYSENCCCTNCPECAWAIISETVDGITTSIPVQLELQHEYSCPVENGDLKCNYVTSGLCSISPWGITIHKHCDGTCQAIITNALITYTSDLLTTPYIYGSYTFTGHSEITLVVSERDATICGDEYACVSYMKVGETWDVARVIVPYCALPQGWEYGWTEDFRIYGEDFFECRVVEHPTTVESCKFTEPYIYQNLCYKIDEGIGLGYGPEIILYACTPFPAGLPGSGGCTMYQYAQRWHDIYGGDNNTLFQDWDGTCRVMFYGGGLTYPKTTGDILGPYGTYEVGYLKAIVYECSV